MPEFYKPAVAELVEAGGMTHVENLELTDESVPALHLFQYVTEAETWAFLKACHFLAANGHCHVWFSTPELQGGIMPRWEVWVGVTKRKERR